MSESVRLSGTEVRHSIIRSCGAASRSRMGGGLGPCALPLDWLSGCGGLAFACCRIWLCLAAICRWQGAKAHSLFQNLLSYLSYASYTSYPLARHKREAPFVLFTVLFTVAFGYWKCYYSPCFKESDSLDSLDMIFDIGGGRMIAAIGLERGRFLDYSF